MGKANTAKMERCLGGGLLSLSLSLSLSRCLRFLTRLCVKFKGLFCPFCRSFISFYCRFYSFYRNFILSCRKFFLFLRSFNSSFCLQKAFFRTLCFFEIFKCFIFGIFVLVIESSFHKNGAFCHFEPLQKGEKSTKIKENLPFLDTLLALSMTKFMTQRVFGMTRQVSMTNLGCRLNLIVCHALILSKLAMTKKWQVLAWNL